MNISKNRFDLPGRKAHNRHRVDYIRHLCIRTSFLLADTFFLPILTILAITSRFVTRKVDIGLGPVPIINSIYHKKCFLRYGYSCETFADSLWGNVDEFDIRFYENFRYILKPLIPYACFIFCIFRYRCLYLYFNGGPLRWTTILVFIEPLLLRIAGVRVVLMCYGADVNVLTRSKNLRFIHGMAQDYPGFRHNRYRVSKLIDIWTHWADHIIAGCDWVDYLYYWDTLMLSHFAYNASKINEYSKNSDKISSEKPQPLRLIHAPNHRHLKGTSHIIKAVEELQSEGISVELKVLEGVKNQEVIDAIIAADVVIDQLIIGWYAMFAIEGMSRKKPVVCYLRNDLLELYTSENIIQPGELPIINASSETIKNVIRELTFYTNGELLEIGEKSKEFTDKFHSIEAIGKVFDEINFKIGIQRGN